MSDPSHHNPPPPPEGSSDAPGVRQGPLASLDQWMALSPFHPRLAPFVAFVAMLLVIGAAYEREPRTYPFLVAMQGAIVCWLLWRYRKSTPEVTFRFHWSALVAGVLGAVAWIGLGLLMVKLAPALFEYEADNFKHDMREHADAWWQASVAMRLIVTAAIVPVFEELLFRSALLRSMQRWRPVKLALVQFAEDLPGIGDRVLNTKASDEAAGVEAPMAAEFHANPLGRVTLFAVVSTILLWCVISHLPRDWPGTIACGLLYIGVCWYTNSGSRRLGLGPVIWAHGITNALLVAYTLYTNDWQFL